MKKVKHKKNLLHISLVNPIMLMQKGFLNEIIELQKHEETMVCRLSRF